MNIPFIEKLTNNENPLIGRIIFAVLAVAGLAMAYNTMFTSPESEEGHEPEFQPIQEKQLSTSAGNTNDMFKGMDQVQMETLAQQYQSAIDLERNQRDRDEKRYKNEIADLKKQVSDQQIKQAQDMNRLKLEMKQELLRDIATNKEVLGAKNNTKPSPAPNTTQPYQQQAMTPGVVPTLQPQAMPMPMKITTIRGSETQYISPSEGSMIRTFKQETPQEVVYIDGDRAKKQKTSIFVPPGSLLSATLLTGMDAPAGTSAKENPFPTLARVKGQVILPNYFTIDLEDCHLISSGYGSLAASRAYIRTEKLSCVMPDGTAFSTGIDAYASGTDGKAGLMGEIITRNSDVLLQSLAAGILSGFAEASQPQKIASLDTSGGGDSVFTKNQMSDIFQSGVLGGASSSLNRLADYYLEMAEEMFPVVEIKPGRKVDFITLSGFTLQTSK